MSLTKHLTEMLRAKYAPPAWAFLTEIANGTGAISRRWADAVAMSIWPSRGLHLHGFEVKVSRSDWKRELDNPAKAEPVFQYCDYWWLVIYEAKIVEPGELPATWGLLCLDDKGKALNVVTPAPKLGPQPWTRPFLAELLRKSAVQTVDVATLKAEYDRGLAEGVRQGKSEREWETRDLEKLRKVLSDFEKASGVKLDTYTWGAGRIGDAVKAYLEGTRPLERLEAVYRDLGNILNKVTAAAG
jgi:hypothetical protein